MDKFKKFFKALESIVPQAVYSLGLVINKSGKKIMWGKLPFKAVIVEVDDKSDELELLKQAYQALKTEKWLVLDLKAAMPARLFAVLRQLSLNNHLQIIYKDKIIELKQSPKSRIIAIGEPAAIKKNEDAFAGFKNLFGPAIIL